MLVVLIRGVPELVLAVVFVVITGLGAVAGTLALAVGSVGLLGKLVADSLEEVDPGPEQAVRATGPAARRCSPPARCRRRPRRCVGHVLYQLDVNIRSATLLGIVGAGGIGFDLLSAAQILEFGLGHNHFDPGGRHGAGRGGPCALAPARGELSGSDNCSGCSLRCGPTLAPRSCPDKRTAQRGDHDVHPISGDRRPVGR